MIDRKHQVWEEVGSGAIVLVLKSVRSRGKTMAGTRAKHTQHHLLYLVHEKKGDSADEWSEFPDEPWEQDPFMKRIA